MEHSILTLANHLTTLNPDFGDTSAMEFFHNTNIDFIGQRTKFFILSLVVTVAGLVVAFAMGIQYGIDFEGGTEIAVQFSKTTDPGAIRSAIESAGYEGSEIKSYGKQNQYLIRVMNADEAETGAAQNVGATSTSNELVNKLKSSFPDEEVTLLKSEKVGPKVGAELRQQALIAVVLSIIAIMIYVAFRFEFIYGVAAIIALIHDVLVAFAAVVICNNLGLLNGLEINQNMIAAFLTVVGFSINDTVIIFDRIRENRELHKNMALIPLMNMSINETLSRTINTVMTVVLVLLTMVVLGGEVLSGFSFAMLIGIVTGAYSSIYIASSFVIWYLEKVKKVNVHGAVTPVANKTKAQSVKTV